MERDQGTERQFLQDLLAATLAGRANWTGTVRPGLWQFVAGDHIVAMGDEGDGPALTLHHSTGHRIEILRPGDFAGAPEETAALFTEIISLARTQALGLRRRWRRLGKQLAAAPASDEIAS